MKLITDFLSQFQFSGQVIQVLNKKFYKGTNEKINFK
ncbi:hypothetical protein LNTAR_16868 [Lentisphaera araneosa HTCC2155]|uniref:Uncharacterized protein n=1 Tax=Lentisphaera araneosa HTCC2155 TaxID=313628 RepID=A6DF62_9BACT|nr:hypothetical protein LNTAR_16868 [Lentisphaera araneosa HTCC2155]